MTVTHILLGRPWLYDRDVYHSGKNNTYHFTFNDEQIVLKPMSAEQMKQKQEVKPKDAAKTQKRLKNIAETQNKHLFVLNKKKFEQESRKSGVVLAVRAKEKSGPATTTPQETRPESPSCCQNFQMSLQMICPTNCHQCVAFNMQLTWYLVHSYLTFQHII